VGHPPSLGLAPLDRKAQEVEAVVDVGDPGLLLGQLESQSVKRNNPATVSIVFLKKLAVLWFLHCYKISREEGFMEGLPPIDQPRVVVNIGLTLNTR
jgi:hypothetical protein